MAIIVMLLLVHSCILSHDLAVVIVPVADATTQCFECRGKDPVDLYTHFPFAPEVGPTCLRFHQLLFNETVTLTIEKKDEVKCEVSNIFYMDNKKRHNDFWTLKTNIKRISELSAEQRAAIPVAFKPNTLTDDSVVTLCWPWKDTVSQNVYSAGTRFVRAKKLDTKYDFGVTFLDYENLKKKYARIPKKLAVVAKKLTPTQAIESYVELIKKWANQEEFIPYVWGGCSFIDSYAENRFNFVEVDKKHSFWLRPLKRYPIAGLECSALIFRAAQIYGIPYFCKNSYTLTQCLETLKPDESVENGDLIWYKGHVVIVSDVSQNKIIEAVGYKFGYGKVHEIELNKLFKNMKSFDDLKRVYLLKKPLERLTKTGEIGRNIDHCVLLKMKSVFRSK